MRQHVCKCSYLWHKACGACAAGMGCSAGVIAVGLAQRLLAGEPNSRALVVSTENITLNWYSGNERSMLIPNTLFRMGGAGVLLTNRLTDRWRAKYSLEHIVRVHLGRDDSAYRWAAGIGLIVTVSDGMIILIILIIKKMSGCIVGAQCR